jgi:glutamate carboxypeptidase
LRHLDTVFPSGTVKERPFHAAGGRASDPGVCDGKGGLTAVLQALRAHRQARSRAWERTRMIAGFLDRSATELESTTG